MNTTHIPRSLTRGVKGSLTALATVALLGLALLALVVTGPAQRTAASSHREAPLISADPSVDNTDLYAFVSPDVTNTVTIIANYIGLELPDGGPNWASFADNAVYEIRIDNTGNGEADIVYQFRFHTQNLAPNSFLYINYPLSSISDTHWLVPQTYDVTRIEGNTSTVIATGLRTPPVNVGPRSTPNYANLAAQATYSMGGRKFFAGQRDDPFFVDLGSIFDLGGLRPFNQYHLVPLSNTVGIDGLRQMNVHSIAIQVPMTDLTADHQPPNSGNGTVGIWATALRHAVHVLRYDGTTQDSGPMVQVSRLGNPLVNEVIIPRGLKDYWNTQPAASEKQFLQYYQNPELASLENALYGSVLQPISTTQRADLVSVLLTGLPGFNLTGTAKADMLRLNMNIPVAANPSRLGPLDPTNPDLQGYPNGRRLADDIVDIDLRAVAQGYGPTLHTLYGVPDLSPNDTLGDGVNTNDKPFLNTFPYEALPTSGYEYVVPPVPLQDKVERINDK